MDCLNLLLLEDVTRKERNHQEHDQDEKRPGAEELLGANFRIICHPRSPSEPSLPTLLEPRGVSFGRVPSGSVSDSAALPIRSHWSVSSWTPLCETGDERGQVV